MKTRTQALTYFDNGATSYPKPPQVAEAMSRYLLEVGGSYGRSAYRRAVEVTGIVEECRDRIADLIGVAEPEKLAFTANATQAANTILQGIDLKGAHVLMSSMEHNALARPLEHLRNKGDIELEVLPSRADGTIDLSAIPSLLRPDTRLMVICHASNVSGVVQPLDELRQVVPDLPLLVDASQSLGKIDISVDELKLDYLIFTGHKGLLGPTGTGGFYARVPEKVLPLLYGGTGSRSESVLMPESIPDKYEAGTPNVVGLFGLNAALQNRPECGYTREALAALLDALRGMPEYTLYAADDFTRQTDVFSLTHQSLDSSELAWQLYEGFGIEIRSGMHCAPLAHSHLGTFPAGTCRFSLSPYHTDADLVYLLDALRQVSVSAESFSGNAA